MSLEKNIQNNHAKFQDGLVRVEDLIIAGDLEEALQLSDQLAYQAWIAHCGLFASLTLESLLARISNLLPVCPPPEHSGGRRRVLTVMSSAHAVGGHSRIAWRWIKIDKASKHTLVLTQQRNLSIPQQILELEQQGLLTIVQLDAPTLCARVDQLRALLANADHAILLTHPNDVLPCAALPGMSNPPSTIFVDHASHVFWLGVTVSRLVLNTATIVLERRRGIPTQHIAWSLLPMDFDNLDEPRHFDVRARFDIPAWAPLLLSCGSAFKYWPIEGVNLASVVSPVLERNTNAHLLIVGVTPTPFWDSLSVRFPGRIHLQDYLLEHDLVSCYHACDIYLDSLPVSSPTTLLEAAAIGKPIVRFAPTDWRDTGFSLEFDCIPTSLYLWSTPENYEQDVSRLITDTSFRTWRGQFSQQAVRLYYSNDTFMHCMETIYERALVTPTITPNPNANERAFERLDQLLAQLAINQSKQTGRESSAYLRWTQMARIDTKNPLAFRLVKAIESPTVGVTASPRALTSQLNDTLQSIPAQICNVADVLVLSNNEYSLERLNNSTCTWLLLLCDGDVLEIDAQLLFKKFLTTQCTDQTRIIYFDHDEIGPQGIPAEPHFKPDFNYDLLLSYPYMGRALAVRTSWAQPHLASSDGRFDLVLAYRLALTAYREAGEAGFLHIPALLAHLSPHESTVFADNDEAWQQLAQLANEHLQLAAPDAQLLEGPAPGTFQVVYPLARTPLVSIIIPTRDQLPHLNRCIESLFEKTSYPNFEILVVDNDSQTPEAREFLMGLAQLEPERIRVLRCPGAFNFSRMNNVAVKEARGELILMLNNDTAAIQADWLTHMVGNAMRDDVGVVGARLLYPDGGIQHAGVILGLRGPAEHPSLGIKSTDRGYLFHAQLQRNYSAVTAACLMVSKALYQSLGGLDESNFGVSYNDVDFCLRVGQTGRRIVWTPLATLIHEGSASQKRSIEALDHEQKVARFTSEQACMYQRWPAQIARDPAYNPNLSLAAHGYEIEVNPLLILDKLQGLTEHRVIAFAADEHGCGQYRIYQPMQAMLVAGMCTGGAANTLLGPNLALRSGADTFVFQRPSTEASLHVLESLQSIQHIKKIYEVDDNLLRVPLKSAHHEPIGKALRQRSAKAIRLCDRVVVSTEALAHELTAQHGDIRVMQNCLSTAMWGIEPPRRLAPVERQRQGKPRVGWAGGVGHQGDIEMIANVIKELADQVDWIFFGMCPESIQPYVKEFYAGVATLQYPQRLMAQDWDLAIAPLEINPFNECKSNLKLLEYGWCGVPVVCSDITPYQGNLPATRVKNRFKDWRDAICERIADLDSCHRDGLALQDQVALDWTLKGKNLQNWFDAWTD